MPIYKDDNHRDTQIIYMYWKFLEIHQTTLSNLLIRISVQDKEYISISMNLQKVVVI